MNGTQASSCSTNEKAEKITKTFAYCLISVVSLVGNTFIGIIVYKTKAMRKTTNFFIVNMAMSDLLLPIFLFPQIVTEFHYDSWLIRGPLGQALCKMYVLFANVSTTVSIQSLVLIAVDRFGAVVFPLRPPLINSKLCLFLISATWIVAMAVQSPYLVAYRLVEYSPGKLMCVRNWNVAFGKSSSYRNYILAIAVVFFYTPLTLISVLYCKIILKLKSQTIPGEQSVSAGQQRMKRERNVLKMAIAIVLGFAIVTKFHYDSWLIGGPLGQALCKMYVLFADVSKTVSVQSLVLIAVDRFGAVVFPLRPPLINSKLCLFLISATWIVAMAVQSPYLFAYRLVEYSPGKLMCVRNWNLAFGESSSYRSFILAIFLIFLYTPLAVVSVLYCKIILKLKSQTIPGEQSANAGQQRAKRERNVLKMAIAIVVGFAVCWLPFTVLILLRLFAWTNKTRLSCGR
ncbi:hypothetical protein ACROYT_G025858 [Oculina patagonica]